MSSIYDINREFLKNLDYQSLLNACSVNKEWSTICVEPYFWKLKLEHDYGTEILSLGNPGKSYQQQYHDIKTKDIINAIEDGDEDIVYVYLIDENDVTDNMFEKAIYMKQITILDLFDDFGYRITDQNMLSDIFRNTITSDSSDSVIWLLKKYPNYTLDTSDIDEMIGYSNEELREILTQRRLIGSYQAIVNAVYNNNPDALKWAIQAGHDLDMAFEALTPEQFGIMEQAIVDEMIPILEIFKELGYYPDLQDLPNWDIDIDEFPLVKEWMTKFVTNTR